MKHLESPDIYYDLSRCLGNTRCEKSIINQYIYNKFEYIPYYPQPSVNRLYRRVHYHNYRPDYHNYRRNHYNYRPNYQYGRSRHHTRGYYY